MADAAPDAAPAPEKERSLWLELTTNEEEAPLGCAYAADVIVLLAKCRPCHECGGLVLGRIEADLLK